MKTTQIMEREFDGCVIRQNHKTGYLNLNDLSIAGNKSREARGLLVKKDLNQYFQTQEAKEFMKEVAIAEGITVEQLKVVKRGRGGGQYAHPLVFLDVAMWYDQKIKVAILKWFYDNLLMFRDNSGDSFKAMNIALDNSFNMSPKYYPMIANAIAAACGVGYGRSRWNCANEGQLKLRDTIQNNIALLADMSVDINVVINKAISKAKP